MNTQFNTIETISNDSTIINKSAAYIAACDSFEVEASKFANNENFVSRKSAEEVSLNYAKAQSADCEYSVYVACFAAEKWLEKAWNNAD
ncbi:MAG: hypothetical protein PHG47_11345 [Sulfuricella sp.]|nr:hypothetical protein [Sulfuricella sp.]